MLSWSILCVNQEQFGINEMKFILHTTKTPVMKTANIPVGSSIVFRIVLIIVVVVSQSANGQNWNTGESDVKWQMHCDFPGHDIDRVVGSGENCADLCIASHLCTHFRHASDGFCYLKKALLSTPRKTTNGGMCGFVPWKFDPGRDHWNTDENGIKWLKSCDFFGHDISRVPNAAGEQCGGMCTANPECNHFRHDQQFCFLKKAPMSTPRTPINGGMCGFIPSRDFLDKPRGNFCPNFGLGTHCRPNIDCSVWFDDLPKTKITTCKLINNGHGSCCPNLPNNKQTMGGIFLKATSISSENKKFASNIKLELGQKTAMDNSLIKFQSMLNKEQYLVAHNITVLRGSSSELNSLVFHTTQESQEINFVALQDVYMSEAIVNRFKIKPNDVNSILNQFDGRCPPQHRCIGTNYHYRTLDGSCNNIQNPTWGQARTQFQRILSPVYFDGIRRLRHAKSGGVMPNSRLVSSSVVRENNNQLNEKNTNWVPQFGQFIDHDITLTVESKMKNLTDIECCLPNGQFIDKNIVHPECLPIEIPTNDPFYSKFGRRCMSFVRSAPARRSDCKLGHAEQMNDNTHFLDASQVYGSDEQKAKKLRSPDNLGRLNVTHFWQINREQMARKEFPSDHHQFDLLPGNEEITERCTLSKAFSGIDPPSNIKCFDAGDPRANVIPNLAVTHSIFLRQHNKLVAELSAQNPHRDGEHLYQEARRIVVAQMQHITYKEFLPVVIGREKMIDIGLLPLQEGFSKDYDPKVNPSIVNEFAAAAFRFGHSLVLGNHRLVNPEREHTESVQLRNHYFKSQTVYMPGNLDKFLIGLATQHHNNVDNSFTAELSNHLFEEEGKGFGLDLVSLNIQRGRDHGLPGYNAYRELCGLSRAINFNDLHHHIPRDIVDKFQSLYSSVDDIDLFIAGVSERPVAGALVGPTFQCIIADQFLKLKQGDRFFYDLGGQPGSFTESQLKEIRKTSLARLVCDNSNVKKTQPLLFKSVSDLNPIVDCDSVSIPGMNLFPWSSVLPSDFWHIGDGGVKWHLGCDFPGHDISVKDVAGEKCGKLCINESRCNAFSHDDIKCFLKNIPSTLKRKLVTGGICGFLPWKF